MPHSPPGVPRIPCAQHTDVLCDASPLRYLPQSLVYLSGDILYSQTELIGAFFLSYDGEDVRLAVLVVPVNDFGNGTAEPDGVVNYCSLGCLCLV